MNKNRLFIYSILSAVLFSGFFVVGRILQKYHYISCLTIKDFLIFCLGTCFCAFGIMILFMWLDRFSGGKKGYMDAVGAKSTLVIYLKKHVFFTSFLIVFICYIPVFLASFPGVFSYDAPHQVWQFVTGNIGNNQPVISSAIIYGIMTVGKMIFGSWEGGVAFYIILQIIFASVTFSYIITLIYRKTDSILVYVISLAFFALHPINHLFVVNCAKDVAYAYFTVWIIVIFGEGIYSDGMSLKKMKKSILLTVFLFLFLFYRSNSVYALIIFLPVAFIRCKYARRRLVIIFSLVICIYFLITGPLYEHLGVIYGRSINEMMSIPTQQITNTYIKHGGDFTEEEKKVIFTVFPEGTREDYQNMYKPENSDMIRPYLDSKELKKMGLGRFIKVWAQIGLKYPGSYIEAALNNTRGYWYIFHEISGEYSDRYIEYTNSNYKTGIHTKRYPLLKGLAEQYRKIGEEYSPGAVKGLCWLFSIASTLHLYLLLICYVCYRRDYKVLSALVLPMSLYLTVLAGPLALLRYVYPMMLGLPYFWGLALKAELPT